MSASARHHGRRSLGIVLLCALALLAALALAAPASAPAAATLCEAGEAAGQCEEPEGLAIDTETERLYLADRGNDRIDVFDAATEAFLFSFGAGELDAPRSVAVDNDESSSSRHDVYVADFGNRRIAKFDDEGNFLAAFGAGEYDEEGPESTEAMLVATSTGSEQLYAVDVRYAPFNAAGECVLGEGGGTAEECYVTRLRRYEPGGGPPAFERDVVSVETLSATHGNLGGLAVDSEGNAYIRNKRPGGSLCKYDAAGERIAGFREEGCFLTGFRSEAEGVKSLAVDAADRLFAGGLDSDFPVIPTYRVIAEYSPAGSPLRRFGYGELSGNVDGLAVYGEVAFAAESKGDIVRIVPFPPPGPIAAGPEAEGITSFKAELRADVNPEGKPTDYRFDYVTAQVCEEDEAEMGPGHCFDHAKSGGEGEIPIEAGTPEEEEAHFRLNRAEATIGCPDPEAEAELPESPCLTPETEYRWRIVATSEDSPPGEPTILEGEPFSTTEPLEILAVWPTAVGADSAALHARVNPFGAPASGYFEYLTEAEYEANLAADPEDPFAGAAELPDVTHGAEPLRFGSGEAPTARSATAFPLKEGTAYRFRLLATNPLLEEPIAGAEHRALATLAPSPPAPCPAEGTRGGLPGARSGAAAFLPDCRAYELVSPLDKNNSDVLYPARSNGRPARHEQSSAGGDRMTFSAKNAFADPAGAPWASQYLAARRAGQGWRTHAISSRHDRSLLDVLGLAKAEFEIFSPDLCTGWLRTFSDPALAPGAVEGNLNLYRRTDSECGGPSYEAITTIPQPDRSLDNQIMLRGAAADGRRAIFSSSDTLPGTGAPPEPAECATNPNKCAPRLYSRSAAEGTRYVCVLPGGGPAARCNAGTTQGEADLDSSLANAISADGERIYFSAPGEGRIYVRENPGATDESPRVLGAATGHGNVIGPGSAKGRVLSSNNNKVTNVSEASGLVAGQEVSDSAGVIPAGTTIEECLPDCLEPGELILSREVTGNSLSDEITGHPSATLAYVTADTGAFQAGQTIEGPGIPAGASVESCSPECGEAATSLTLSEVATESREAASLEAFSPCVRPLAGACTTPVSRAAEARQETTGSFFWGAAADGSRAILTTGALESGNAALYSYDVEAEAGHEIAGEVYGVAGTSADARRLYFATAEALEGANVAEERCEERQGEEVCLEAQPGRPNLYYYEAAAEPGEEGAYAFIGTLARIDIVNFKFSLGPVAAEPTSRLARVTPSGGALAFMSAAPLTGFDNTDASHGEADMVLFLYDAATDTLRCASCNPSGQRPLGINANSRSEASPLWAAARINGWENPYHAPRNLSENGRRLFFETAEQLTARDTDGRIDVYQWEAPGEGTCTTGSASYAPSNGGCIDLISSGLAARDVEFRDASASGEDVFFATGASLLPQDYGLIDIYDARAGGGLPLPEEVAPGCEGEACQSPPPAPAAKTPASSAFRGAGNVTEAAAGPFARCNKAGRRARAFSKRARRLRRAAKRTASHRGNPKAARRAAALRRKAKRYAKGARRQSRHAKRCRVRVRKQQRSPR